MPKLKEYTDFRDFAKFNKEIIESNPFLYFHLHKTITRVLNGECPLYKFFNVIDESNFVSGLLVHNECLLYANNITEHMVPLVAEGLELNKFNRYQFFGTKNIINALFSAYNINFTEQKHRKYYQCEQVRQPFSYAIGEITMGELDRLPELIELSERFVEDFYDNEKAPEDVESTMLGGILKRNIFQWVVNDKVVGVAQIMYEEFAYPVIGHVFTHPDFRGLGIAASLTHKITQGLLEHEHEKCWLMTNAYNPASNRAFEKVGYRLVGEYVVRYKEE